IASMLGCYAYSLGYVQDSADGSKHLFGLSRDIGEEQEWVPLLADRPPFAPGETQSAANSPNHGGRGQNVVFVDGRGKFLPVRRLGVGDDIYMNHHGHIAAGITRADAVLGCGWASPGNPEDWAGGPMEIP